MKYNIVRSERWFELEDRVNDRIKDGWRPIGGVAVTTTALGDEQFFQAMIKDTQP